MKKSYEVGYCKPPKETQFQKGQSGNSKGRPKKERDDVLTLLQKEMHSQVTLADGQRISKEEAMVKQHWKPGNMLNPVPAAMDSVKSTKTTVPVHLQDAHYRGHESLGHGIGYKYAHDYPNHYVEQQYLPDEIKDAKFYIPSENGYEKTIREHFKKIKGQE